MNKTLIDKSLQELIFILWNLVENKYSFGMLKSKTESNLASLKNHFLENEISNCVV